MKQELLIYDIDYIVEDSKGIIRLFCKSESGKTFLVLDHTFEPYFYVEPGVKIIELKKKMEDFDFKDKGKVTKVEVIEKKYHGDQLKLLKVFADNPRNVSAIRDVVKEWEEVKEQYEYTISFPMRYTLDKRIEPSNWIAVEGNKAITQEYSSYETVLTKKTEPISSAKKVSFKSLAFDLELVEEDEEEKIIMISLSGCSMKKVLTTQKWGGYPKYVEVLSNEKSMIESFVDIVREFDPDFICTYNGDGFDFPKLRDRANKLKIPLKLGRGKETVKFTRRGRISSAEITGRLHIDLYNFVEHILSPSMNTEVLTLDAVANELLGVGKTGMKWKEIKDSWKNKKGLERIAEYALRDAELTLALADHLLPQIFSLSKLTGTTPFDAARYYYSQLVEHYLMKKACKNNILIPNMPKYDEIQERQKLPPYTGAMVVEPKKGIHSNVLVFDFRSMYSTIIVTHNISPETLDCGHEECIKKNSVPETKHHFCTKTKGFIPTYLEELIKARQEIKKKMKSMKKDSENMKFLDNQQFALKIISNALYGYFNYAGSRWYCRSCGEACAALGRFYIKKIIDLAQAEGFEIIYGDTDSCMVKLKE